MPDKELRLLALDGSGVRGLFALMIFEYTAEALRLLSYDLGNKHWQVGCHDILRYWT